MTFKQIICNVCKKFYAFIDMTKVNTQFVPFATLLFFLRSSSGSFGSGFMSKGLFASLHTKSNNMRINVANLTITKQTGYFCIGRPPIYVFLTTKDWVKCVTGKQCTSTAYYITIQSSQYSTEM